MTTDQIKQTIDVVQGEVLEGNMNPLQAFIMFKAIEKKLKVSISNIQEMAMDEANKYGEKSFEAFGAKVQLKSGAGRWDFKSLDWWQAVIDQQDRAKSAYKLAEHGDQLISDDGEVVQPAKYTHGKETISIEIL